MAGDYPKRPTHFAHKFVRLLTRTCDAMALGQGTAWLLTVIAHTEDAKHYTAPVTFWNDQLINVTGL